MNLARNIQDIRREASAAGGIGNVYRKKGQIPQAMEQYQHQLRLARASGDNRLISTALYNLALCYGLQGEISQAMALAEESLQALEHVEGTLPGMIRENLEKWKAVFQPD
jgi:tetratricopeptide (TPR) repeat protein